MSIHVSHFVTNGSLQTAYNEVGEGAHTPFVLVHGYTGSKLDFANQLGWFAQGRRVISYDQRGHGESSNTGPYDLYTLVADLLRLLDELDIETCHILGHSLGGMVVMRALLAQPGRFTSAVLMDTSAGPLNLFPSKVRSQLNKMVEQDGCAALLKGMQGQPQNEAVQRGINYLGEREHWRRIRVKLEQMDPVAFVQLSEVLNEHPAVLSNLSGVDLPVTVLVGAEDQPFIQPSRDMADTMANATLVTIPNAGHSPQYENHIAWREAIEEHLDRCS